MEFPLVRDGVGVAAWEAGPMPSMDGMQHVNVYRRRRGRGGPFRFLMAESGPSAFDALERAVELVKGLRDEFPEYEFLLLRRPRPDGFGSDQ
jgi:hypothetical protein